MDKIEKKQKALWYVEQGFVQKHNAFFSLQKQSGSEKYKIKEIAGREFWEIPFGNAHAKIGEDDFLPPVYVFDEITSTLDIIHELSGARTVPFSSVICREQTNGRGQLRRNWQSLHDNLYIALVLPRNYPFDTDAGAPAFGAMVACALEKLGFAVEIKWPNDLVQKTGRGYVKVGGILLEERNDILVAGMGINCFSAPADNGMREDFFLSAGTLKNFCHGNMKEKFLDIFQNSLSETLLPIEKTEKNENFRQILGFWFALVKEIKLCYEKTLSYGNTHTWKTVYKKYLAFLGETVLVRDALLKSSQENRPFSHEERYSRDIVGQIVGLGQEGELLLLVGNDLIDIVGGSLTRFEG